MPQQNRYGPLNSMYVEQSVVMSLDEYETIRLIDLQGFTQEECSEQMGIARTTVQKIYSDARKKLADSIVNGKILIIEGGDIELCDGAETYCRCGGCNKHRCNNPYNNKESE